MPQSGDRELIYNYVVPPTVLQNSTVGAGDRMVAGMIPATTRAGQLRGSIKWGLAGGTAATATPGMELCRK